ncbi:LINE-1 retrotransposable element ORF2 protein [Smittium mucronatum]|uniref:LINE-1 retrotransposable element ORF2 protein n=1 Tax=Smittium mucronatum TaxID=133383 RepID=A0A1R0GMK6_9FUNG|nr:LINE-1 retrotransposable element ORF2 protein [Smittium mucronatum]
MVVRIRNQTNEKFKYKCGILQGCPASPILFNFFIKDIFEGMHGVYVKSLGKKIPGLLLVDDAVVIENAPESLQNPLNSVSNLANTQEMKINATK